MSEIYFTEKARLAFRSSLTTYDTGNATDKQRIKFQLKDIRNENMR